MHWVETMADLLDKKMGDGLVVSKADELEKTSAVYLAARSGDVMDLHLVVNLALIVAVVMAEK